MSFSKPQWLKVHLPASEHYSAVASHLRRYQLHTICLEARCPNRSACWGEGTATFLILGNRCTRNCAFCAVSKGRPLPPEPDEPGKIAEVINLLGIRYAVITSVTRDDLPDGGASAFAATVDAIRRNCPSTLIELLIPDFQGSEEALQLVFASRPEVIGHNLETPVSIYPLINRKEENYFRSLLIIKRAKESGFITKSGLMVGLGESRQALRQAMKDLIEAGCDLLTIGQYLQPTKASRPVARFYSPEEFKDLEREALELGFKAVASGPLVRSSYLARQLYSRAS